MKNKFNYFYGVVGMFVLSLFAGVGKAFAQATATPAEMLNDAGASVVNTSWTLILGFLNTWFGYLLVIILIGVLVGYAFKLMHIGGRK